MKKLLPTLLAITASIFISIEAFANDEDENRELLIAKMIEKLEDEAFDPNKCRHLWAAIGMPEYHGEDGSVSLPICREHFLTQFNFRTNTPNFVIERLTKEIVAKIYNRPDVKFKTDPKIAAIVDIAEELLTPRDKDYTNSGFHRGHQAASADFASNYEWMKETFTFANAVPQIGHGFNSGIWKELEADIQNFALTLADGESIYVITGPIAMPFDGAETIIDADFNACNKKLYLPGSDYFNSRTEIGENKVAIPAGLYKIIYEPTRQRVFGYVFANIDHRNVKSRNVSNEAYYREWRASIDVIEDLSQTDFFTKANRRWNNVHERSCPTMGWRQ